MSRVLRTALLALTILASLTSSILAPVAAQEATPAAECLATTPEENEALVIAYWEEFVWGDQGKISTLLALDEVHHWGVGGDTEGIDAFRERLDLFLTAFPDIEFTVDLVLAENDLAATVWTASGTNSGDWQGIAATGREVTWRGINIFRIECGLIAESWGEADHLGLRRQLGATDIPMPQAVPADASATPMAAPAATPCPDDTLEENVAVARRWTEDVLTGKNLAALDEILDPAVVHHAALFRDLYGPEGVREALAALLAAFPDARFTVDMTIASGDLIAVRWTGEGTHDGPFLGVEPSGHPLAYTGINIYRISCGRIVEGWSEADGLGLLRQLLGESAPATPAASG